MSEYEILKKAYDRLEKLYAQTYTKYVRLKKKSEEMLQKNYELEGVNKAHVRLNRKLMEKLENTEKELEAIIKRQETGKKSSQRRKKG
jgi:hypothetical protein